MSYRIAGIDVHKKMLAVVVSDVEIDGEYQFERRLFGSSPDQLRSLAAWLLEHEVDEVVMESTAQYWKPVWEALERYWEPIPLQCFPNWFPILGRRFHDHFIDLVLKQPCGERSQLVGAAAKKPPFKLVLTIDFDVRHDHSQHLLVDIDSRYPV